MKKNNNNSTTNKASINSHNLSQTRHRIFPPKIVHQQKQSRVNEWNQRGRDACPSAAPSTYAKWVTSAPWSPLVWQTRSLPVEWWRGRVLPPIIISLSSQGRLPPPVKPRRPSSSVPTRTLKGGKRGKSVGHVRWTWMVGHAYMRG